MTKNIFCAKIKLLVDNTQNIMKTVFTTPFRTKFGFRPVDPLADGLGDDIAAERRESQAIRFDADDSADIQRFWNTVERDIHTGGAVEFAEE